MTMTRQHFALIAEAIKDCAEGGQLKDVEEVAACFARKLHATDPAFNRERFLRACGVEG